jgi:hypothetical protein
MKRRVAILIGFVVFMVAVLVGGLFLIAQSAESGPVPTVVNTSVPAVVAQVAPATTEAKVSPVSLEGSWTLKNAKGGVFNATVTDTSIEVLMESPDGTKILYWNGTFDAKQSNGATIISELIDTKAVLSKAKTKNFTVGLETLSFDFTAMGSTKQIDLRRG